jgi:4-amino-4-deoxy-L-arabinose transferase-like glycosyltransferase
MAPVPHPAVEARVSTDQSAPFPVFLATVVGYVIAASLLVFGVIGVAAADQVSDPFGVGILVLGAVVGLATVMLGRGHRVGRAVLAGLAAITLVVAVVYAFAGPGYAAGPGIATAVVTLGTIALLYLPQSSKDFFTSR